MLLRGVRRPNAVLSLLIGELNLTRPSEVALNRLEQAVKDEEVNQQKEPRWGRGATKPVATVLQ